MATFLLVTSTCLFVFAIMEHLGVDLTSLLRSIARDLLSTEGWNAWIEALVRDMPGEVGFAARRLVMGSRFGQAGSGLVIYPGVRIFGAKYLKVGNNCRISYDCIIQANGGIELGDEVIFGPGVKLWSVNHVFERTDAPIFDQGYEHKAVVIGDGVWLGANSFVMPGARIGEHVVLSAGSVVAGKDVEPYSILAGNPARKVGSRRDRLES